MGINPQLPGLNRGPRKCSVHLFWTTLKDSEASEPLGAPLSYNCVLRWTDILPGPARYLAHVSRL